MSAKFSKRTFNTKFIIASQAKHFTFYQKNALYTEGVALTLKIVGNDYFHSVRRI
jgi:hypothetical protein